MYPAEEWLIIAFACAFFLAYVAYRRFKSGKLRGDTFFWAFFCPAVVFMTILAWAGKYRNASDKIISFVNAFFDWATRTLGLRFTQILIAFVVTALGFGAHVFKQRNQRWYGNVEVVIGFLTAFFVAGTLTPGNLDLSKWATLAGAAYIVARGLGNRKHAADRLNEPDTLSANL